MVIVYIVVGYVFIVMVMFEKLSLLFIFFWSFYNIMYFIVVVWILCNLIFLLWVLFLRIYSFLVYFLFNNVFMCFVDSIILIIIILLKVL